MQIVMKHIEMMDQEECIYENKNNFYLNKELRDYLQSAASHLRLAVLWSIQYLQHAHCAYAPCAFLAIVQHWKEYR
jgi:hypothetical protein